MTNETKRLSQMISGPIASFLQQNRLDDLESVSIKRHIQHCYNTFGHFFYAQSFLNWGLWDQKIYNEYQSLDLDFSLLQNHYDIYAPLLHYFLIRPLIKIGCFNQRLLDIGCGNGIGVKLSSELLKTRYAIGVDLAQEVIFNASQNFYKENEITYLQSDAEHLALANETIDIVTSMESSHLYPQLELFFSEVERVLAPGGFFCYADIRLPVRQQDFQLEKFIQKNTNLLIVEKHDITKMVQSSIYRRLISNEAGFYQFAWSLWGDDEDNFQAELSALASNIGIEFLPWWKIWFKNPAMQYIAKNARKSKYWGKKKYFYYLIRKAGR